MAYTPYRRTPKMNHKVTFQRGSSVSDGMGGQTTTWAKAFDAWCDIMPVSGDEATVGGMVRIASHDITHRITLIYSQTNIVTPNMRGVYGDRIFSIRGVYNKDEENRWQVVSATEEYQT